MTGEGFGAILAHLFLKNSWVFRNLSCESLWEQGNVKVFFQMRWSHDQDDRHALIWLKRFEKLLLQNQWAVYNWTWYVALYAHASFDIFE